MGYTAFYSTPLLPGGILLGAVLLLLIVPVFAMAALAVALLAGLALAAAATAALVASPFLLVSAARRRWSGRTGPATRERAIGQARAAARTLPTRRPRRPAPEPGAKLRA